VREFAVRIETPAGASGVQEVLDHCAAEGVAAGFPLGRDYPEHEDGLLVAITERRSRTDIDRLADVLGRAIGMAAAAKPVAEGAAT
jgi:glycine dehydrogenase subunit 1